MQVFLDGRLATKGGTQKGIKTTPFVMIGRCDHPGQGSQYFQGSLSDLRIYKRVLKSEEIESLAKGS